MDKHCKHDKPFIFILKVTDLQVTGQSQVLLSGNETRFLF